MRRVLEVAREALEPAARALSTVRGHDRRHLYRSMATHRTMRLQLRRLREVRDAPRIQSSRIHAGVAFGATAAVLVAFAVLALDADAYPPAGPALDDAGGLGARLDDCLNQAQQWLNGWRLGAAADRDMVRALGVERRALQRALVGVRREQLYGADAAAVGAAVSSAAASTRCAPPRGRRTLSSRSTRTSRTCSASRAASRSRRRPPAAAAAPAFAGGGGAERRRRRRARAHGAALRAHRRRARRRRRRR